MEGSAVLIERLTIALLYAHLNEFDPSLVRSRSKACHVANNSAAKGQEGAAPTETALKGLIPDFAQRLQVFVLFPIW